MAKIHIKRVKREKKTISVKQKILTGLGVAGSLTGLAGAPMRPAKPPVRIVSTKNLDNNKNSSTSKIKQKLVETFGVPTAKADDGYGGVYDDFWDVWGGSMGYYEWNSGGGGGGGDWDWQNQYSGYGSDFFSDPYGGYYDPGSGVYYYPDDFNSGGSGAGTQNSGGDGSSYDPVDNVTGGQYGSYGSNSGGQGPSFGSSGSSDDNWNNTTGGIYGTYGSNDQGGGGGFSLSTGGTSAPGFPSGTAGSISGGDSSGGGGGGTSLSDSIINDVNNQISNATFSPVDQPPAEQTPAQTALGPFADPGITFNNDTGFVSAPTFNTPSEPTVSQTPSEKIIGGGLLVATPDDTGEKPIPADRYSGWENFPIPTEVDYSKPHDPFLPPSPFSPITPQGVEVKWGLDGKGVDAAGNKWMVGGDGGVYKIVDDKNGIVENGQNVQGTLADNMYFVPGISNLSAPPNPPTDTTGVNFGFIQTPPAEQPNSAQELLGDFAYNGVKFNGDSGFVPKPEFSSQNIPAAGPVTQVGDLNQAPPNGDLSNLPKPQAGFSISDFKTPEMPLGNMPDYSADFFAANAFPTQQTAAPKTNVELNFIGYDQDGNTYRQVTMNGQTYNIGEDGSVYDEFGKKSFVTPEDARAINNSGMGHDILPGETLSQIAQATGVSMQQIMAANPSITDPNKIYTGQHIVIPAPDWQPPQAEVQIPGPDFAYVHTDMGDLPKNIAEQMGATILGNQPANFAVNQTPAAAPVSSQSIPEESKSSTQPVEPVQTGGSNQSLGGTTYFNFQNYNLKSTGPQTNADGDFVISPNIPQVSNVPETVLENTIQKVTVNTFDLIGNETPQVGVTPKVDTSVNPNVQTPTSPYLYEFDDLADQNLGTTKATPPTKFEPPADFTATKSINEQNPELTPGPNLTAPQDFNNLPGFLINTLIDIPGPSDTSAQPIKQFQPPASFTTPRTVNTTEPILDVPETIKMENQGPGLPNSVVDSFKITPISTLTTPNGQQFILDGPSTVTTPGQQDNQPIVRPDAGVIEQANQTSLPKYSVNLQDGSVMIYLGNGIFVNGGEKGDGMIYIANGDKYKSTSLTPEQLMGLEGNGLETGYKGKDGQPLFTYGQGTLSDSSGNLYALNSKNQPVPIGVKVDEYGDLATGDFKMGKLQNILNTITGTQERAEQGLENKAAAAYSTVRSWVPGLNNKTASAKDTKNQTGSMKADVVLKDGTELWDLGEGVFTDFNGNLYSKQNKDYINGHVNITQLDPNSIADGQPSQTFGPNGTVLTRVGDGTYKDVKGNVYSFDANNQISSTGIKLGDNNDIAAGTFFKTDDANLDLTKTGVFKAGATGAAKGLLFGGFGGLAGGAVSTTREVIASDYDRLRAWALDARDANRPGVATFTNFDGQDMTIDKFQAQTLLSTTDGQNYLKALLGTKDGKK